MSSKCLFQTILQIGWSKGLYQVTRYTCGTSLSNLPRIIVRSHHEDGKSRALSVRTNISNQINSVSTRHIPVAKHDIKLLSLDHLPSHVRTLCLKNFVKPQVFEHTRHDQSHRGRIVNHQYLSTVTQRTTHFFQQTTRSLSCGKGRSS